MAIVITSLGERPVTKRNARRASIITMLGALCVLLSLASGEFFPGLLIFAGLWMVWGIIDVQKYRKKKK